MSNKEKDYSEQIINNDDSNNVNSGSRYNQGIINCNDVKEKNWKQKLINQNLKQETVQDVMIDDNCVIEQPIKSDECNEKDKVVQEKSKSNKKKGKIIFRITAGILLLVVICLCFKYIPMIMSANSEAKRMIKDIDENLFYSKSKIESMKEDSSNKNAAFENSEYVTEEDCDSNSAAWNYAVHAAIDVEDRNFYDHNGVDIKGLAAAVWTGVKNGGDFSTRGGSTITQQLVKLVILNDLDKTEERKAKEICLAMKMEEKFSKDQIIEFYLNNVNYRHKIGIARACDYYYGKKLPELNLAQIAYISAIPNRPLTYDPYNTSEGQTEAGFNAKTKKRMKLVLDAMLECESITEDEYNEALNFDVESTLQEHDK